jgi:N-methylhydantoinase B
MSTTVDASRLDPIRMAVLANRMDAICREMTHALQRAGRSAVLSMGRDFSVAIVTHKHELLASAESLPVHVLGIELQARAMAQYHPVLEPGDAFLDNDPYVGNTHHADHTILVPVMHRGRHLFTVCAKSHQADTGNSIPTTYFPTSVDIYEEGSLNFPCIKVQADYADNEDIIRMCRRRIRVPDQWYGDYLATLGAARLGERRLTALLDKMGEETVTAFADSWLDYSELRMRKAIERLPESRIEAEGNLDPFPGAPDGIRLRATIDIRPDAGEVVIDLRDNVDCVAAGINMTEATSLSTAAAGLFNTLEPDIPHNSGSFRRLQILLREGSVVGIPVHPTSCSMATTVVADRVVNMIQAGLADLGDNMGVAEGGLGMAPGIGVISGRDSRSGDSPFINQVMLGQTGGPGSPVADGWINYVLPVVNGLQYRDSVEIDEQKYPMYVYEQRLVQDSEGAGRRRGAPAGFVSFGPSGADMTVAYAADGAANPPQGVHGGLEGGRPTVVHVDEDGNARPLPMVGQARLRSGERIETQHCGGGGYGDPRRREPERVLRDVREGLVSVARARDIYGVVVVGAGGDARIDDAETASRR